MGKGAALPRRSDATKSAILAAARERFAAQGYDRATIRAIAADADIDPAMVMRYFGSKERLFAAAANFDLGLPDLATVPAGGLGRALVAHFIDRWEVDDTFVALLRAAVTHPEAAKRMRGIFAAQVAPTIARLDANPATAAVRAGLVSTQFLGLALTRYVLKLPPVVAFDREQILRRIGPVIQRFLREPLD